METSDRRKRAQGAAPRRRDVLGWLGFGLLGLLGGILPGRADRGPASGRDEPARTPPRIAPPPHSVKRRE